MRNIVHSYAAGPVDMPRLERALDLRAEPFGRGRYRVLGGAEPHWVDLHTANHPRCDCADYTWRDELCKHILAALLREGDEGVLFALRRLVGELKQLARAA